MLRPRAHLLRSGAVVLRSGFVLQDQVPHSPPPPPLPSQQVLQAVLLHRCPELLHRCGSDLRCPGPRGPVVRCGSLVRRCPELLPDSLLQEAPPLPSPLLQAEVLRPGSGVLRSGSLLQEAPPLPSPPPQLLQAQLLRPGLLGSGLLDPGCSQLRCRSLVRWLIVDDEPGAASEASCRTS